MVLSVSYNHPFKKLYETKSIHGSGLNDIRYKILCNPNFSLQEKINLFT